MWLKFLYFLSLVCLIGSLLSFVSFRKKVGLVFRIKYFLKGLVFTLLFAGTISAAMFLRMYEAFDREKLIAEVTFQDINSDNMELVLKSTQRDNRAQKFILRGEQWMIGGEILRWKKPLYFWGLNSLYKLTRISGRYLDTSKEQFASHQEINGGTDKLWLFLYRNQSIFPFIDAVYGNAVYAFPKEKTVFKVYVNKNGYSIRE
ncbi:MAG: hypothetical protein NTZ48_03165 [Candidatus Omnitrophica bacterium]|nr:hypothetical protein [Candidatus Omnitrophota bacterium]